ncbi:MAG: ATP synthase F1 subunit epsilon [Candidatus Lloydbacteria bacterium RIFCSPHIGHO2_01_FULL_49_22]|uniref:ATP synthase F1 subunit epsilon n=1 Tax=Candidatus Lloydbacteria bacterium RIFCSPHIGHO2_01_FULL_49_22 TaxID=1798658 RepID=A0A1G2CV17_9BACT|nr:MAG: ATP synthase F1 subunit epsilon [Candidatus Lloydbacteria bacterium RIFCSPHIGHO2_01_FULL_49_22]OGZ10249.1 MAG: ATP synthase F1 subunit epsilon [Candidatus Lloydbacteria bacterium RIFCSPHIGHO2_02_FULL_50_18]
MKLTIAKIDKILWSGEAESVSVPGTEGVMTILSHHMPLITTLEKGELRIKTKDGGMELIAIEQGMLEVNKEETVILV